MILFQKPPAQRTERLIDLLELVPLFRRPKRSLRDCGHRSPWSEIPLIASVGRGFVLVRVADEAVLNLMGALRRIAERNIAEVEQVIRSYFNQRDSLEPVSREELLQKSRAGELTVLDVRPPDEFALGHLPDAVNIPLRELEARLAEFDPAQEIVAYCRGPYCVLSYEAVAALRARGFKARRLEDGLPEWRASGLPVVTGNR